MNPGYDIVAIGDTTVDVFLEPEEVSVLCDIKPDSCQVCFTYADKIPVKSKQRVAAVGNSANFAVGASRLGQRASLYTILGNDQDGQECKQVLESEDVSNRYIEIDKNKGTNFSAVIIVKGERTILVFHEEREYKLPSLAPTPWVYYSSVGKGSESLQEEVIQHVKKNNIKLGVNPGTFQLQMELEGLASLFEVCEVLILNKEEGERLMGKHDSIPKLLEKLYTTGAKIVVVTNGSDGAYCFDGTHQYFLDIFDVPVLERTGAGDSFSTGFITALSEGEPIEQAMRWGMFNAAAVIQKIGAQEALLTHDELQVFLKEHPEVATVIDG